MALFRERVNVADCAARFPLGSYMPCLILQGLHPGVDNMRHDVYLSPRFVQIAQTHISGLIAEYGEVRDMMVEPRQEWRPPSVVTAENRAKPPAPEGANFKDALADLLINAVNHAKGGNLLSLEMLCRLAVVKFLRREIEAQYSAALERCRARVKASEGRHAFQQKAIGLSERAARFQLAKKAILRRTGQELFATLRDLEKTSLARLRRSLFGDAADAEYELFLNRLLFVEDGRDDLINAEHYVMLGNYEGDPDRFGTVRSAIRDFLSLLGYDVNQELRLDGYLNEPENAQVLLANAEAGENSSSARLQMAAVEGWVEFLRKYDLLDYVIASYEAVPLLAEYSPPLNPQQLKHALVSRNERKRVETLLNHHGNCSLDHLAEAARRIERCSSGERSKIAVRFFQDFLRYHRDLRRLEALNSALDTINVIATEKMRDLSAINRTLYEFQLTEEQKPAEDKVVHHIILKADIRDSTLLTRTLYERGLNPASHFSLNFYDPINKLLPKYAAQKLFIEGDALILALFEHEGEVGLGVARTCVLAKEIIETVRGYNEQLQKSGLPVLELGIGIAYQDTAPMYLMDGTTPIMISPALNASDRLSSCSKSARKFCGGEESVFNVYAFQTVDDADTAGQPDEFLVRYNIGGIVLNEAAFSKLREEISLEARKVALPTLWDEGAVQLYMGVVPVAQGIFHKLIVREALIPHIDAREFQLKAWTGRKYYEVCTNPAVYEYVGI